jgi:hypothetical protein
VNAASSSFTDDDGLDVEETAGVDPVLGHRVIGEGIGLIDPFTAQAPPAPVLGGRVYLIGASGGAGVSTLARLANELAGAPVVGEGFDPARLKGIIDDPRGGFYAGVPFGAPVWIVARMEHHSLDAAISLVARHSQGTEPWTLAGMIGVHGPVPATAELVNKAKGIRPALPRTLWFPWESSDDVQGLGKRAKLTLQALIDSATEVSGNPLNNPSMKENTR